MSYHPYPWLVSPFSALKGPFLQRALVIANDIPWPFKALSSPPPVAVAFDGRFLRAIIAPSRGQNLIVATDGMSLNKNAKNMAWVLIVSTSSHQYYVWNLLIFCWSFVAKDTLTLRLCFYRAISKNSQVQKILAAFFSSSYNAFRRGKSQYLQYFHSVYFPVCSTEIQVTKKR